MDSISYKIGLTNDQKFDYKQAHTLEERISLRTLCKQRRPECQLVICEPHFSMNRSDNKNAFLSESKFLISETDTVYWIQQNISKNLGLDKNKQEFQGGALFIFSRNTILQPNLTVQDLKEKYLDPEDGLIYIKYARHDTFGAQQL